MVEHVADGLFDAFQCRLKQTPHRLGTESQHALRRPADVATGVLAYQTLNAAALRVIHHTALAIPQRSTQSHSDYAQQTNIVMCSFHYLLTYLRRPCSDFTDMLWRLTNCRIIILFIIYLPPRCTDAVSK